MPTDPDLNALFLAGLDGDARAYARLLHALRPRLQAFFARRIGRDAGEVEDLVQETLIAIHTKRATFDRSQPFGAWLFAIARYKLVDHFRRTGRRAQASLDDAGELAVADESAASDARADVARGLAVLSPRTRELVQGVKLDGTPVAELAARTGLSEGAVKVAVHRGVARMAAALRGVPASKDAPPGGSPDE